MWYLNIFQYIANFTTGQIAPNKDYISHRSRTILELTLNRLNCLLSTNWWQGPIAEDSILTNHWTQKSGAIDYSEPLSYRLVFTVLEDNLHTTKGEGETPTRLQTLVSTMMMFARCAGAIVA